VGWRGGRRDFYIVCKDEVNRLDHVYYHNHHNYNSHNETHGDITLENDLL
jgi:hypothetical protein